MNFADVTDIVIPQGEVIKIHETATGRVLWEKITAIEINPKWYKIKATAFFTSNQTAYDGSNGGYIECIGKREGSYIVAAVNVNQPGTSYYNNKVCRTNFGSASTIVFSKGHYRFSYATGTDSLFKLISVTESLSQNEGIALVATINNSDAIDSYLFIRGSGSSWLKFSENNSSVKHYINTEPVNDTSVFITYSPERSEYLVTGLKKGLCIVPKNFSANGAAFQDDFAYHSSSLRRTKWVADLNLYLGATETDGKVYYSSDGITWNSKQVLSGNVLGIEYLSKQKKLIAISNNSKQIALSLDGLNWTVKEAPFSAALAYAYDTDNDVLCVVDKTKSYASSDLEKWTETVIPNNEQVDFRTIIYFGGDVFIANSYRKNKLYVLSLIEPIEIDSRWVAS